MHRLIRQAAQHLALCSVLLAAGTAQAATRSYLVTDFDSVRLEAPVAVSVLTKRSTTAHGEGDTDLLERIDLNVEGRILTIRLKKSPFEGRRSDNAGAARLTLTVPSLRSAHIFGAGTLILDGLSGQNGEISVSGTGSLTASSVDADILSVAQQGAGSLQLAGKAKKAIIQLSGSGDADASGLSAADLEVNAQGAGTVKALASRSAKVTAVGPATVTIDGHPACDVHHAGGGQVVCAGKDY